MKILCQHCGQWTDTHISGRKKLDHTVKNVSDALKACRTVTAAAKKLNCSRGYIYWQLKKVGMTAKELLAK